MKIFSITKKIYCAICGKRRKFKNSKIYIFKKALALSIRAHLHQTRSELKPV